MVQLRHPCIVSVIGGIVNRKDVPYLILEHMEQHSLQEILENQNVVLEGEMVMPILNDVVNGMRCLHELASPIVHGDLRAKNVLVDKNFRAKVHNFGFSNKAVCHIEGSAYWMSPERLRGERAEAPSDVYAYGMLLYEVFTRKEPFEGEKMISVLMEIADDSQSSSRTMMKSRCKRPIPPRAVPMEMRQLMKMCWDEDPLGRPTFRKIHERMGKASMLGVANQALEKIRMTDQLAKGANKVLNQVKNTNRPTNHVFLLYLKSEPKP
jgi:guanylate cyclase